MEITSVNNELVKEVAKLKQKKYRDESKKFLLEGAKCVQEALAAGIELETIFIQTGTSFNFVNSTQNVITTTDTVLKKISTTETPPEIVAVGFQRAHSAEIIKSARKLALLEDIRDMGNLGTIIRTAAAFELDGLMLYGDCAEVYAPKCVRSAVGNLWKIPIIYVKDLSELKQLTQGFQRIATVVKSDKSQYLKDFSATEPAMIMFGSEACGLSEDLIKLADKKVTIEMSKKVESLNLSVSAGIILYELFS